MTRLGLQERDIVPRNIGERLEDARKYRASKRMAYEEGFEEFAKTSIPVVLNGRPFKAHRNINLYIDMTSACDADCDFCIAKVNFTRNAKPIDPLWVREALDICAPANPSIQITGGEPTLFPAKLRDIINIVGHKKPRRPVINTNGRRLADVIDLLIDGPVEHVNISRHHYNDSVNARIMRTKSIDSETLGKCTRLIRGKTRIQCNLLGGEIDTYGEVMQFLAYCYHKLSARNIVFALLTPLPKDSFYAPSIIKCVQESPVDADVILRRIEDDSRFVFEKYRGGVACYYEVWKYMSYEEPMTVIFKYSDNYWLEKADADDLLLPDLVLHTDGTLSGSWCKDRKIIAKLQGY